MLILKTGVHFQLGYDDTCTLLPNRLMMQNYVQILLPCKKNKKMLVFIQPFSYIYETIRLILLDMCYNCHMKHMKNILVDNSNFKATPNYELSCLTLMWSVHGFSLLLWIVLRLMLLLRAFQSKCTFRVTLYLRIINCRYYYRYQGQR